MGISGSISVNTGAASASTPAAARGAAPVYQPSHVGGMGPAAPTAPIPGSAMPPQAPVRQAAPQEEAPETQQEEAGRESWRLAKVAQKDKAARERLAEARAVEARIKADREALEAREAKYRERETLEAELRRNPRKALEHFGFNPEAALQFMLNGEKLTPEQQLAASVDARISESERRHQEDLQRLRDEDAEREKRREAESARESQQRAEQDHAMAIQEFKGEIVQFLEEEPGFKLIRKMGRGGVDAVFEEIDEHYNRTAEQDRARGGKGVGQRLSLKDAAELVKARALKEAQDYLADEEIATELGLRSAQRYARPAPPTLTNRGMAPAPVTPQPQREETVQEKTERVKAFIEQQLRQGRAR